MMVHLIKLCVGADSVDDLAGWIAQRLDAKRRRGEPIEQIHTTRMTPRRREALLEGGSLYWVIRGLIQCRQHLLDIRSIVDDEGVSRCQLLLEPELVLVEPRIRRPFQGWRYLDAGEAPADIGENDAELGGMPPEMRRELVALGLL